MIEQMPALGQYYGPWYHVVNYVVANELYRTGALSFVAANHALTVIVYSASAAMVFGGGRLLFGAKVGWTAVVLFVLAPHMVGHAHYNPKDIPLMATAVLTLMAGYLSLQTRRLRWSIVLGVAVGAGMAIKLSAVAMVPPLVLCHLLADRWKPGLKVAGRKDSISLLTAAGGAAIATLFVLWPSLWIDPTLLVRGLQVLSSSAGPGTVMYMGDVSSASKLPWHYIWVHLGISLPIPTLAFLCLGVGLAVRGLVINRLRLQFSLLLASLFLPLLIGTRPGVVRYDGFRQFLFVMPAVVILAALGAVAVASWITVIVRPVGRRSLPLLLMIVVAMNLIDIHSVFPYTSAYVNQAARSLAGTNLGRWFELEYWGATYKEAVAWISAHADQNAVVCVPVAEHLVAWYDVRSDLTFACNGMERYLIIMERTALIPRQHSFGHGDLLFRIERFGVPLLSIYGFDGLGAATQGDRGRRASESLEPR